jgi:hypothetical protein
MISKITETNTTPIKPTVHCHAWAGSEYSSRNISKSLTASRSHSAQQRVKPIAGFGFANDCCFGYLGVNR